MTTDKTAALESATEQRQQAKRATLAILKGKKPAEREATAMINGEAVSFLFKALSGPDYDKLVAAHPPTDAERVESNAAFRKETFAPALLARVCAEPDISTEDWADLRQDPNWSKGEWDSLYFVALELCNRGLNPAPFGNG